MIDEYGRIIDNDTGEIFNEGDKALQKLDAATRMLAEAETIKDIKNVVDLSELAKAYFRRVKKGTEAQNKAAEITIHAKRKGGEFLAQLERDNDFNRGNQHQAISSAGNSQSVYKSAIEDAAISYQEANRWQQIADVPEPDLYDYFEKTKEKSGEITTAGVLRLARQANEDEFEDLPDDKYRVIYADPPWKYGNTMPDNMGVQDDHYKLKTVSQLCELPVKEIVSDDSVLFLWVTSPILEESFQLINAWGFKYKASFVWDKVKHVMGHYNSVRHEFLLVCTRGSCQPDVKKLFDSVITEERTEHSKKPEVFRKIIDTIYPVGKRIELFARESSEGWESYGNEI